MMTNYIHEKIQRPKEEIAFCYTKRRPFLTSILRRRKVRTKTLQRTITKTCSKCGHVSQKPVYKFRIVWGSWTTIKKKEVRSMKRAIQIAEKWFNQYANRKVQKVKVLLT